MITLEPRQQPSRVLAFLSPFIAIALMLVAGAALLAALGYAPGAALRVYFAQPFIDLFHLVRQPAEWRMWAYTPSEVIVKAIPLILIGAGLAVCFRADVWNIGAAGQYVLGAIAGGLVALHAPETPQWLWLPVYLVAGILGGMLWGAIPALLKTRFNANEILVSLMLTYVAALLLDWLVRGPWIDPAGFGFPESAAYSGAYLMPVILPGTRLHLGLFIALAAALALWLMMRGSLRGFALRVAGAAPRAAGFAGFSRSGAVWFAFLLSGGLAGLAGAIEISATIQQLQPVIGAEYGFTAIIVAFLGRLNPLGAIFGGLVLAITYIGGENAQILLQLPQNVTGIFQGMLLFFLLSCDTLIRYRLRLGRRRPGGA